MPYKRKRQPVRRARRTTKSVKKYTRRTRGPRKYARRSSRSLHTKATGGTITYSKPMSFYSKRLHKRYQTFQTEFYQRIENGQIYVDSSNNMQGVNNQYIYPYADLNDAYTLWGNATGLTPDQDNTKKFFHLGCFAEFRFKNSSNTMAEMDIYVMNPKEDLTSTANPGASWSLGLQDEQYVASTAPNITVPYCSPFDSLAFSQNWNVKKIYHLEMLPGQNKRFQCNVKLGQVIPNNAISGQYDGNFYYRRYTTAIMLVARGTPVSSSTSLGGGQTKVGLSPVTIDFTLNKSYSWKAFSSLPAFFGVTMPTNGWAAPANELTYNIGSGATVAPVNI